VILMTKWFLDKKSYNKRQICLFIEAPLIDWHKIKTPGLARVFNKLQIVLV